MDAELNLVPYMDVTVNLLLFMLVSTTEVMELHAAPVSAPAIVPVDAPTSGARAVTVQVGPTGFRVYDGDTLSAELPQEAGGWPWDALVAHLRGLHDRPDVSPTLRVTAAGQVPYHVVVRLLDAARSDARGSLFPNVQLGVASTLP